MGTRLLVCAALVASACTKVTYVNPGTTPSGPVVRDKGWFFIGGLIGHHDVWANQLCPQGVAEIQSKFTVVDVLLTLITVDIVTPRTYDVVCGGGAR